MARVSHATILAALTLTALGCGRGPVAQCGVASLANVLARMGRPVVYKDLLRRTHVAQGHTTFTDLAQTAKKLGLSLRGYRLDHPKALRSDDLGIIELTADHFVAFVGRSDGTNEIVDSTDGSWRASDPWSDARLESEWTGNVLLVERTASAKKE